MIRLRPSQADEVLIKRVQDWYEPGPGAFITNQYGFSPAVLFQYGEQGAWYDPSDLTTLFQDSAGTTPVTAVEQPVGLMLDKSKGLVLGPELVTNGDFSSGTTGWVFANGGGLANSRCECTTAANFLSTSSSILTAGKWYSAEFDYFMTAGSSLRIATKSTVGPDGADIVAISPALTTNAVTRLRIKFYSTGGYFIVQAANATFTGWVDNISVRELPGNHDFQSTSANRPVLRKDANGCFYLACNGTNTAMQTNSIDFSATDKMTVWAGVRKLSDAARGMVAELGANPGISTFQLNAPLNPSDGSYSFGSSGTALATIARIGFVAPVNNVLTGIGNISGAVSTLRINGDSGISNTASQGTGNYGNYSLYLFARAGTSLFFNGNFYGAIIRGAQSTAAQISSAEQWINGKTKAY